MKSGESLPLSSLNLRPGQNNPVKVSLVYPADATPGHLLSVVPDQQLAELRRREELLAAAQAAKKIPSKTATVAPAPPPVAVEIEPITMARPMPQVTPPPQWIQPPPALPTIQGMTPAVISPTRMSQSLLERYQQAVQAQQKLMDSLMGR
jgi:hypothetical protein